MSASRNLGMQYARGRFIALLDADDVWVPEKLAEQVQLLDAHPDAAMVYGPGLYWHGWTGRVEDQGRDFVQPLGVLADALVPAGELVPVFVRRPEVSPGVCALMVRTSVVRAVGGGEAAFRGMYEDQVLCCKIALVHAVWVSSRVWFRYRQHDRSCCAEAFRSGSHLAARKQFLRWLRAYLPARAPQAHLAAREAEEQWRRGFGLTARIKTMARRTLPPPVLRWVRNQR
jgi:glycosyltransferase involved in cell wall biosynthesis